MSLLLCGWFGVAFDGCGWFGRILPHYQRVCKTCKHTLFMTGVACPCSDVDVYCLRCVRCVGDSCDCPVNGKYLLSWWKEDDLSRFVRTAEMYLGKLKEGRADEVSTTAPKAHSHKHNETRNINNYNTPR